MVYLRSYCHLGLAFGHPLRAAGDHDGVEGFECLSGVAVGVDADLVTVLAAEQSMDRGTVVLADDVPESCLDAGDGVVNDAAHRTRPRCRPAHLAPQLVNVARVLAHEQGLEVPNDPS